MAATLIDGNCLAADIRRRVRQRSEELASRGRKPRLAAVLIGATPATEMYARRQSDACAEAAIGYELIKLPPDVPATEAIHIVEKLSADPAITGVMIHQPVPEHIDGASLLSAIHPAKDVEGVSAANLGYLLCGRPVNVPCTALAAMECIAWTKVTVRGAEAVVVGASEIVGKPAALLLSDMRATVTICRSATANLAEHTRRAAILVAAVGKPGFITADHVAEGAVVIDVGINRVTLPDGTKRTVGDVDFEAVSRKAGFITPVPGGVGPLTVAMLLRNTVDAAARLT